MRQSSKRAGLILGAALAQTGVIKSQEPVSYSPSGIHSALFDEIDIGGCSGLGSLVLPRPSPHSSRRSHNALP